MFDKDIAFVRHITIMMSLKTVNGVMQQPKYKGEYNMTNGVKTKILTRCVYVK